MNSDSAGWSGSTLNELHTQLEEFTAALTRAVDEISDHYLPAIRGHRSVAKLVEGYITHLDSGIRQFETAGERLDEQTAATKTRPGTFALFNHAGYLEFTGALKDALRSVGSSRVQGLVWAYSALDFYRDAAADLGDLEEWLRGVRDEVTGTFLEATRVQPADAAEARSTIGDLATWAAAQQHDATRLSARLTARLEESVRLEQGGAEQAHNAPYVSFITALRTYDVRLERLRTDCQRVIDGLEAIERGGAPSD